MDIVTILSIVLITLIIAGVILVVKILRALASRYINRRTGKEETHQSIENASKLAEEGKPSIRISRKSKIWDWLIPLYIIGIIVLFGSSIIRKRDFELRQEEALEILNTASNWPIVVEDTFNQNSFGWDVGEFRNNILSGDQTIANGEYTWNLKTNGPIRKWSIPEIDEVSDFLVQVDARLVSSKGSWESYFGLVFCYWNDGNFDSLMHSERVTTHPGVDETYYRSKYFLVHSLYEHSTSTIIDKSYDRGTLYPGLVEIRHRPEGVVELTLVSHDSSYHIFMEGEYIESFDLYTSGQVGLIVLLPDAGEEATIAFDNFVLRAP